MSNKKRLMYLLDYLKENTNENHHEKTESIIAYLNSKGIECERKTIYNDVKNLTDLGYTIEKSHDGYYYSNELFNNSELRVVVDAIKASSFLTEKKSKEINDKLLSLTNKYDRKIVEDGLYRANKSGNEQILYNIDSLMVAINEKRKISFKYFDLMYPDKKVYRENNYQLYPYYLIVNNERYYLICGSDSGKLYNYRLDKMEKVELLDQCYDKVPLDINEYMDKVFKMFNGESKNITIKAKQNLYQEILFQFGKKNIIVTKNEQQWLTINVNAIVSPTFFSWLFQFDGDVILVAPDDLKQQFKEKMLNQINKY